MERCTSKWLSPSQDISNRCAIRDHTHKSDRLCLFLGLGHDDSQGNNLCCQPFSAFATPLTPSVRNSSDHSSCLGIGEEFLARFHSDHLIQVHASLGVIYVSRIQTAKGSSYEWEPQEPDPFD